MNKRIKEIYALFLLAVFVTSLGVGALHFLEHRCTHDTEKHEDQEKVADKDNHECQTCYVIFGTTFLGAEELDYSLNYTDYISTYKDILFSKEPVIKADYGSFSLRAPPIY